MRTNYEMTQADLDELLSAMKPVPYMIIGSIPPKSRQENANDAWKRLGDRMGFDHMTVQPNGQGDRFFSAEAVPQIDDGSAPSPKDQWRTRVNEAFRGAKNL